MARSGEVENSMEKSKLWRCLIRSVRVSANDWASLFPLGEGDSL
jgi:hypothetical protein